MLEIILGLLLVGAVTLLVDNMDFWLED